MRVGFLYLFLAIQFFSCAQVHNISQKTLGTYTVQAPGNIAVDASGYDLSPRKISVVIYIETSLKDLNVKHALAGNSEFALTQQLVNAIPFMAGINFKSNEKVLVNVAQNNFLWKIDLAPFPIKKDSEIPVDTITLKGTYQGKLFEQKITNWVELAGIPIY